MTEFGPHDTTAAVMNESAFPRLAYLTGEYPKASHTFILREISSLRDLGATVLTATIRRPDQANLIGDEEVAAAEETFFVLGAARSPVCLLTAHARILAHPQRWFHALLQALRTGRPGLKGLLWQVFYFLEAGVLADWMKREKIDHLHNHFADSSANVAMLAAALADIPFSFTLHGPAELFEPESWHLRDKIDRAAFTVCISHFARSQAMLFSDPIHWPKIRVIHCGVTPDRYDAPPKEGSGLDLLFVGRLTGIKGLRVLFEALEAVRITHPEVTLTLIGDGDDRAYAEASAKRLGRVTLLGFQSQEEVAAALARADALVLPSFAEGVPVVLMEAMASARPVIATQVGGVAELVEDERSGLLVPPGSAEHLADAIRRLADDPALRRNLGAQGRETVRTDFDVTREAARILSLFAGQANDRIRPDPLE